MPKKEISLYPISVRNIHVNEDRSMSCSIRFGNALAINGCLLYEDGEGGVKLDVPTIPGKDASKTCILARKLFLDAFGIASSVYETLAETGLYQGEPQ